MVPLSRRSVLSTLVVGSSTSGAGCLTGSPRAPSTDAPCRRPPRSDSPDEPTDPRTDCPEPPQDLLPRPRDGWTRTGVDEASTSDGTVTGWRESDASPRGVAFDALVLRPVKPYLDPGNSAEWLACVGWQAVVVHDGLVFAANSGTPPGRPSDRS